MLPVEIAEYKRRWKPEAYTVRVHSDLHLDLLYYLKDNVDRKEYIVQKYTDNYEHTVFFLKESDRETFLQINRFRGFTNQS